MGSVPAGDSWSSRTTMAKRMAVLSPGRAHLGRRASAKWRAYPSDVLPLPVAEMDFPIAGPIAEALHAAIRRSDLGYASPRPGLAEALAGFTAGRWGWHIDPADVTLAPEVGVGVVEVLRLLVRPGDRVVINPPVYDSFFPWIVEAGCRLVEVPLGQTGNGWALDLDALQAAFQDGPASTCCAHRTTPPAPSTSATTSSDWLRWQPATASPCCPTRSTRRWCCPGGRTIRSCRCRRRRQAMAWSSHRRVRHATSRG